MLYETGRFVVTSWRRPWRRPIAWVYWLASHQIKSQSKVEEPECNSDSHPSPP
jgi:hypothetical protein